MNPLQRQPHLHCRKEESRASEENGNLDSGAAMRVSHPAILAQPPLVCCVKVIIPKLNSVFHLVEDGAGGFHVNTEFNFAGVQGTGEPSGGHYTVPTTARSTFYSHSDGFPIIVTETTSSTVIGQGQLPDSTAHILIHFTIHENDTVTAEVIHVRSECK